MGQHKSKVLHISGSSKSLTAANLTTQDVNCLIDTDDYQCVTPLWLAVRYNDLDLVEQLIQAEAKVNHQCGSLKMTPLHIAVYNHNTEIVTKLIEAGANPNIMDHWNYTPLMYAAIYYDPYTVEALFRLLIDNGCTVNFGATRNKAGDLEHWGVNIDIPDLQSSYEGIYITYVREPMGPTSGTALHLAVQNPYLSSEALSMLLSAGAIVDKRNIYGQTPMMCAMLDIYYDYHSEVKNHAEMLIKHGTDLNAQDIRGWTCFHYAAQRGQVTCMELLLKNGADCNVASHCDETPLWLLLGNGWHDGASYLITNGCDINRPIKSTVVLSFNQNIDICRYGEILPVEFAICNRYYDVAKLLLRCGCDIDENTWLGAPEAHKLSTTLQTKSDEFLQFVVEFFTYKKVLPSLRDCCRHVIRSNLKQGISLKLDQIPLPQQIRDFICFRDS